MGPRIWGCLGKETVTTAVRLQDVSQSLPALSCPLPTHVARQMSTELSRSRRPPTIFFDFCVGRHTLLAVSLQPVASGTAALSVPLYGTQNGGATVRRLVTVSPASGAITVKSTLTCNPQCACALERGIRSHTLGSGVCMCVYVCGGPLEGLSHPASTRHPWT
jgi:hypothetical protein